MQQALFPKERYPHGHPDLAFSLSNLGVLLKYQGAYNEARVYHVRALAMRQAIYSKNQYPQGHPDLATSLNEVGLVLQDQGATARRGGISSVRWR